MGDQGRYHHRPQRAVRVSYAGGYGQEGEAYTEVEGIR